MGCETMTELRLSYVLQIRIQDWARAGYPSETCGVLIGRSGGEETEVEKVIAARNLNVERARDRYELDPAALLAADEAARDRGLEIIGIWHSHPDHPAVPSETDRAQAWHGWSYVIVSVSSGGVEDLRSWRLTGADFVEERIRS